MAGLFYCNPIILAAGLSELPFSMSVCMNFVTLLQYAPDPEQSALLIVQYVMAGEP
jgi:hypothetical protein